MVNFFIQLYSSGATIYVQDGVNTEDKHTCFIGVRRMSSGAQGGHIQMTAIDVDSSLSTRIPDDERNNTTVFVSDEQDADTRGENRPTIFRRNAEKRCTPEALQACITPATVIAFFSGAIVMLIFVAIANSGSDENYCLDPVTPAPPRAPAVTPAPAVTRAPAVTPAPAAPGDIGTSEGLALEPQVITALTGMKADLAKLVISRLDCIM